MSGNNGFLLDSNVANSFDFKNIDKLKLLVI